MTRRAADKTPGRRWHGKLRALHKQLAALRTDGGVSTLAGKWTAEDRRNEAAELRDVARRLTEQAATLEAMADA